MIIYFKQSNLRNYIHLQKKYSTLSELECFARLKNSPIGLGVINTYLPVGRLNPAGLSY